MTKPCPYCLGEIDTKARKCRHCGEWINKWNRSIIAPLIFVMLIGGMFVAQRFFFDDALAGFEFTSPINERFKILNHELVRRGDTALVMGEVKNEGPFSKELISVQVRALNKENKMVDLGEDYLSGDFQQGETRPFKVSFGCCGSKKKTVNFDHYDIKITK